MNHAETIEIRNKSANGRVEIVLFNNLQDAGQELVSKYTDGILIHKNLSSKNSKTRKWIAIGDTAVELKTRRG